MDQQKKFEKAKALVAEGSTITEATNRVGMAKSNYYYWRDKDGTTVKTYSGKGAVKKPRKPHARKPALAIVVGDAAGLAEFYRSIGGGNG